MALACLILMMLCCVDIRVIAFKTLAPHFDNIWSWEIPENSVIGSRPRFQTVRNDVVVLRVSPYSEDPLHFEIESNPRTNYFSVDSNTGVVKLRKPFDRELISNYTVRFSFSNGRAKGYGVAHVTILDVNDNPPLFRQLRYKATVMEDGRVNTEVLRISADDPDLGSSGEVTYRIVEQDDRLPFRISPSSGVVSLREEIDFESSNKYQFVVEAIDNDEMNPLSSRTIVTVTVEDVQDTPPVFINLPYGRSIDENTRPRTVVVTIKALDGDRGRPNSISYSMTSGNEDGAFVFESSTGKIRVGKNIDRETSGFTGVYTLTVRATELSTDGSLGGAYNVTSFAISINDVNDNRPRFERANYRLDLSENTPVGTTLPLRIFVEDKDQGWYSDVTMSIGWHSSHVVSVSPVTFRGRADVTLILIKTLDFETRRTHRIQLFANETSDLQRTPSSCVIHLNVINENDNGPVFEQPHYHVNVPENTALHAPVLRVHANDADRDVYGRVTYSIHSRHNYVSIKATSGVISLREKLDYEVDRMKQFTVTARDGGRRPLVATAWVTLRITDVNDNPPVFTQIPQKISVRENVEKNAIATIRAIDADYYPNDVVTYTIEPGEYARHFTLAITEDGAAVINLMESLDFDSIVGGAIELNINAADSSHLNNTAHLVVKIEDENDLSPTFVRIENITLEENTEEGSVVGNIKAVDGDSGRNGEVRYYVIEGQKAFATTFKLNEYNGDITVRPGTSPDYEVTSRYDIIVAARDEGNPQRSVTHPMSIIIVDVNDNKPVFEKPLYHVTVRENSNFLDYCLSANDADAAANGLVNFAILAGSAADLIAINATTGCLKITGIIDREELGDEVMVQVKAEDNGLDQKQFSLAKVIISIVDLNDNSPVFRRSSPSTVEVMENTLAPSLGTFDATDEDSGRNSRILYEIQRGNELGHFSYSPLDGDLQVSRGTELDRENQEFYNLTLVATDEGVPPQQAEALVYVRVLDENDNSPEFVDPPRSLHVIENQINTSIYRLRAVDGDAGNFGKVTYSIEQGDDVFFIDAKSGVIDLVRALDREAESDFDLVVVARDNPSNPRASRSSTATISITVGDVNDEIPMFQSSSPYRASVTEGLPIGTPIIFTGNSPTAVDADLGANAEVRYSIVGRGSSYFSVDPESGDVYTKIVFDRETLSSDVVDVIMRAGDVDGFSSETVVKVTVKDVNDNAPRFREESQLLRSSVLESAPSGHVIAHVIAFDPDLGANGRILYEIVGGAFGKFVINRKTGVIYLAPEQALDRETRAQYQLTIVASDRGIPPLQSRPVHVIVTVDDVNDCRPKFHNTSQTKEVVENSAVGTLVTTLSAIDDDLNSRLIYELTSATIYGADGRLLAVDSPLSKLLASDLRFIVNWFQLNATTGAVTLASSNKKALTTVDREVSSSVQLRFKVHDAASESEEFSTSLEEMTLKINIVDRNDNWPNFELLRDNVTVTKGEVIVDVWEECANGTNLLTVLARDRDQNRNGEVSFEMRGNLNGLVDLRQRGPKAEIVTVRRIDRESLALSGGYGWINITLLGSDRGLPPRSTKLQLRIRVNDVNDNKPEFFQHNYQTSIFEDAPLGAEVIRVSAKDRDFGRFGNVTYRVHDALGLFDIHPITGQLTVARSLDREQVQSHVFNVTASDCANCDGKYLDATAQVTVDVIDVNDNSPVFTEPLQTSFSVLENSTHGTVVTRVKAFDPDQGEYGRVTFSSRSLPDYFTVHPSRGDVTIKHPMRVSRHHPAVVLINVTATDGGGRKSFLPLKVNVVDVNNHKPVFVRQTRRNIRIQEELPGGFLVVRVNATDEDLDLNGMVRYRFEESDDVINNAFHIDDFTGEIVTSRKLDREAKSSYELLVEAYDLGTPSLRSSHSITVRLSDIDDNLPLFPQNTKQGAFQRIEVREDAVPGTVVGRVIAATDRDERARIFYHVMSEDGHLNQRTFDFDDDKLILRKRLDRETVDRYSLIIRATNNRKSGHPLTRNRQVSTKTEANREKQDRDLSPADPRSLDPSTDPTLIRLIVNVRDVIDEPPRFLRRRYVTALETSTMSYARVIKVDATDVDVDDVITFSLTRTIWIKSDNTSYVRNDFVIEPETGLISTSAKMAEARSRYVLTVRASDKRNLSDIATVTISIMRRSTRFRIVINSPPDVVKEQLEKLEKLLESVVGSLVVIDDVSTLTTDDDVVRSDVGARVFDSAIARDEIERRLKGGESKLKEMFPTNSFYEIIADGSPAAGGEAMRLRVVIVVLSLILILLSLVFIIILIQMRHRHKEAIEKLSGALRDNDDTDEPAREDWRQRITLVPSSHHIGSEHEEQPEEKKSMLLDSKASRKRTYGAMERRSTDEVILHATGPDEGPSTPLHGSDSLSSF